MKLCAKKLLVFTCLFYAPILVAMMHEVDGEYGGNLTLDQRKEPATIETTTIEAAARQGNDAADQNSNEDNQNNEQTVKLDEPSPQQPQSGSSSVIESDGFEDVPLGDQPPTSGSSLAPKSKVQKFIDAVKEFWSNLWSKLTGRNLKVATSDGVQTVSSEVTQSQPLAADPKTQLRDFALQDPVNFASATAQTVADSVGQAVQQLRQAAAPGQKTGPLLKARNNAVATYEPLQLATKTFNDLNSYASYPKKFDLQVQSKVVADHLVNNTFFPPDSAGQTDLYTQLGKEVLQPRDGIYGSDAQPSELAYAYRRNQGKQMLTDNPAWQAALKLTQGSVLDVDDQGNVVVKGGASSKEQPLTDAQLAVIGQAYAGELSDASLNQEQLLHLARAKMAASGTPADVKVALQELVSCLSNDFYYGDFAQFKSTGQQPARDSLGSPLPKDLQKVTTAKTDLENSYNALARLGA